MAVFLQARWNDVAIASYAVVDELLIPYLPRGLDLRGGQRMTYEVRHPEWRVYPVQRFSVEADWGALCGKRWAVMNGIQPNHFLVAEGSDVTVSFPLR